MAAPYNAVDARVQASSTQGGTYANIGYVRNFDMTEGSEGDTVLRWFGGDQTRAGAPTISGTIPVFWDLDDATGQDLLRGAYASGSNIWLRFLPEGEDPGSPFEEFEAAITEVSRSAAADGEAVEGSFSFTGSPSTYDTGTIAT